MALTANDFLMFLYHYRENPLPGKVPHIFKFIAKERLLHYRETAIAVSGAITALCHRHKEELGDWEKEHADVITRAYQISSARNSREDIRWGDHLMYRWFILGTDREAWDLLHLAHVGTEHQKLGARAAIERIIRAPINGIPQHDSKGNLVGKLEFEDLRLQMARLAREYMRMTINERKLPFCELIWSEETQAEQVKQGLQTAPVIPSVLVQ